MFKQFGFDGSLAPTDGINMEFEEGRAGIGASKVPSKPAEHSLMDVLKKVKSVSPAIIAELKNEQVNESPLDVKTKEKDIKKDNNKKANKEKKPKKDKDTTEVKIVLPKGFKTPRQQAKFASRSPTELAGVF
ncbi:hypothetical protein EIN_186160 [Entamoeba invadens IP1]|uniref:hypothetical protein n=1 Tax=Entamoeba invadens IP1 TaxID=370355 RepID=UPI0002C3F769|nr:hypothetical protein EIN_186160 [Entamoeba invadens IP1]ELP94199.1 hypothetical protein EIN_186160 [Entamoeba invadens IP1]|eukprot:XP_004260970.1 hypothetical protein EIN_186160 [Entamoeba invadens IP1]